MADQRRVVGETRQRRNRRILAASDVCHICGQPGADAVDHVIPIVRCLELGVDPDLPNNLRPAHHNVEPKCNRHKSGRKFAPIIRRSSSLTRR